MSINIKQSAGICALIGSIATGIVWLESRYASAEDQAREEKDRIAADAKLQEQITQQAKQQTIYQVQAEIYFLRDQSRKYPQDDEIKEELSKAKEELEELKQ